MKPKIARIEKRLSKGKETGGEGSPSEPGHHPQARGSLDPAPPANPPGPPVLPTQEEEQSTIEYPEGDFGADDDTEEYYANLSPTQEYIVNGAMGRFD